MTPRPAGGGRVGRVVATAAALLSSAAGAAPAVYRIEPELSAVHFELLHFDTSTLRGRFMGVEGEVSLDLAAHRVRVGLRLPTAGVSTGVPVLDARLRQADLLDSGGHPEAFFVAERFVFDGDRLTEVRGEFTLRGVGQPLSLHAQRFACRAQAAGEVCAGDFEAELSRSDFGISFGLPFVGDRVRLAVQVTARR